MMDDSLYSRIGGEGAVMAAATLFYDKVLADPRVNAYFAHLDMDAQVRKQAAFMTWAFGGPSKYEYRGLGEAHAELVRDRGLADEQFDAIAELLTETLSELEIEPALIDEVMAIVESTRKDVLAG